MVVLGARFHPLRDIYHLLLRASWPAALGLLSLVYLAINLLFASVYLVIGGIENADRGSFGDAFFFSVQTLATIGFGGMHPQSPAANVVVTIEAIIGVFCTAIFTGLVFTKFATAGARIVFSKNAVIAPRDGIPTLMLRIGNDRNDSVLDAHVRVVLTRTTKTREGETFYRMTDLRLARDVAPVLARSFSISHTIDDESPLCGMSSADCAQHEVELMITVHGLDETTRMPIFAIHTYTDPEILHGHRFVDVLSEKDGRLVLDVRRFHDVVAVS